MRILLKDYLLSIACGLAVFMVARALNAWLLPILPDDLRLLTADGWSGAWLSPLDRLATARLLLFLPASLAAAALFGWPLARGLSRRDPALLLPGAGCAALLYFLVARVESPYPFPLWLDLARAGALLISLPLATLAWWRLPFMRRRD